MIELFTGPTPNGHKISIALEELGVDYRAHALNFASAEQKEPWFLSICPNGRIPAIVDWDPQHGGRVADGVTVFESGAILMYLAEKFGRLIPSDAEGRWAAVQWLMFQMGGVGPMQGQANHFFRYAPEQVPYAIERYQNETRRLYEVLDERLADHEYLAGDDYSIADIATWPWVRIKNWSGVSLDGLEHLRRWRDQVGARPAVVKGIATPTMENMASFRDELPPIVEAFAP